MPYSNNYGPPGMQSSPGGMPRRDGTQGYGWDQQNWRPYVPEPAPQIIPVSGRWVQNAEEIRPNEVPMDGGLYFFPQQDYQCIYAKVWSQDGQLLTYRFLPEKKEETPLPASQNDDLQNTLNAFGSAIDQRLAAFEQRMNDILGPFTTSTESAKKRPTAKSSE